MTTTTCVNFIFESKLVKIKEVLSNALSCVKSEFPYISESELWDLRLVYSELLVNAVVHGNKQDSSRKVELIIEFRSDEISSVVRDEGEGFDFQKTIEMENSYEFLSECGRGLRLVSSLTEYLNCNDTGNEIEFHKKISKQ